MGSELPLHLPVDLPRDLTEDISPEERWKRWTVIALVTLLLHLLFLAPNIHWNSLAPPPRVDVQQIDPKKIEAIRNQWRKQQSLLIDTDPNHKKDTEAPKNARYMSDRNIHVDKETRAKQTAILPKPGGNPSEQTQKSERREAKTQLQNLPRLGDLGIPFRLSAQDQLAPPPVPEGGQQYVDDSQVPEAGQTMLNAQESVFYSFYARIYETIGPLWQSKVHESSSQRKYAPGEYITQVDVVFDRNGFLKDIHVIRGSGVPEFDSAVNAAWQKANHFANPPAGLLDQNGEVHMDWSFSVRVDQGFGAEYLPPRRNF